MNATVDDREPCQLLPLQAVALLAFLMRSAALVTDGGPVWAWSVPDSSPQRYRNTGVAWSSLGVRPANRPAGRPRGRR